MFNNKDLMKLQQHLCELKLAERRVNHDMKMLAAASRLIDFATARKLNSDKNSIKKEIQSVEAKIMPNIIA